MFIKNRRLCELSLCHSSYYFFMRERGFRLFLRKLQLANKIPWLQKSWPPLWELINLFRASATGWTVFSVQTTRSAPVCPTWGGGGSQTIWDLLSWSILFLRRLGFVPPLVHQMSLDSSRTFHLQPASSPSPHLGPSSHLQLIPHHSPIYTGSPQVLMFLVVLQ